MSFYNSYGVIWRILNEVETVFEEMNEDFK
jgi:hypothetical protein